MGRDGEEEPLFTLNATAPLGGLWSSVADMARYAAYLADPDDRVVSPETIDEMCRPLIMTDVDGWTGAYGLGFGMGRRGDRVFVGHGGAMPGYLTGLRVRRRDKVGAIVFANATSGAEPLALATDLVEAVVDGEPPIEPAWVPEQHRPGADRAAGPVVVRGLPDHLLRSGRRAVVAAHRRPALGDAVRAREGPDRYRAAAGRERGEVLQVVRAADGRVAKLYFATYAVTRKPLAFADLVGGGDER